MNLLPLHEAGHSNRELVGGKAANLGELMRAGFPVPGGFVVTTEPFARAIERVQGPGGAESGRTVAASLLATALRDGPLDPALEDEIATAVARVGQDAGDRTVFAVRSSATAEDLADASFAGQHATYYYVLPAQLSTMIRRCWASLFNEAAVAYRAAQGIDGRGVRMAVIVQRMVLADTSGVTFTVHPVTGNRDHIVTDASWGMGAAIVDGRVSPDSFTVERASGILIHHRIADKKFRLPAESSAQHSRMEEVPVQLRRKEALTAAQLARITRLAMNVERHFGGPQDIEWSLEGGELFLLQARPVTRIGPNDTEPDPDGAFVLFKPLVENFTEPLTPLTGDLIIGKLPFMRMIRGRCYLDMRFVRPVLPFRLSDREMADLAYMNAGSDIRFHLAPRKLPVTLAVMCAHFLIFAVLNARTRTLPDDFMESFREYAERVSRDASIDPEQAMDVLFSGARFFEPVGNLVLLINLTSGRYFWRIAAVRRLLARWLPDLPEDTASILCTGAEGILSTGMGREIRALAELAARDEVISSVLRDEPLDSIRERLEREFPEHAFTRGLARFLAVHGHRTLKEFELQCARWDEDPSYVLGMIRNQLSQPADAAQGAGHTLHLRREREAHIRAGLDALPFERIVPVRRMLLDWLARRARYFIKLRENSRFYHIMALRVARRKILEEEERLLARGQLTCRDDIFFLQFDEIRALSAGQLGWRDVEARVRARRLEYVRQGKEVPPRTIGIPDAVARQSGESPMQPVTAGADVLQGQGASPGTCEGRARIIRDPGVNAELRHGEILVAPYTDPAWTPLFLTARAAVIEVGSYLSHAGTIAREYGMPCAVDVPDCTARISTGDLIRVDGTTGSVHILARAAAVIAGE